MSITIHVVNRYKYDDPVIGAAVTFDRAAVDAKTPRTGANGVATINQGLADGDHLMRVIPPHTSHLQVGPDIAEDLPNSVTRMYRALEAFVTIKNGRVQAVTAVGGQEDLGSVGAGTNPVRILLQPIYFRSPFQSAKGRKHEDISLIVIHQTAGGTNVEGTLSVFKGEEKGRSGAAHYLVSAEARPKVIKIVQDKGVAGHIAPSADQSWWGGKSDVDRFSIGIETSHKAGTPWPDAQISCLMGLLEQLLHAYPSIKRHRIVGHNDVLLFGHDCPGLEFDWAIFEKFGLGMVPKSGGFTASKAYGGFFQLQPGGTLRLGDRDDKRLWGGKVWPAQPAGGQAGAGQTGAQAGGGQTGGGQTGGAQATVTGEPIKELQTDLREIGYFTPVDGQLGAKTQFALHMFQRHFFAGSRRGLMSDAQMKKREVDLVTAEFIKNVRP